METKLRRSVNDGSSSDTISDLGDHLGYWLRRASNHVSGSFAQQLQARQVSVAEWAALRLIYRRVVVTPGELADLLGVTRGAVSKILDKLENKEWIVRSAKLEDGRFQLISLTSAGRLVLPELATIADNNDRQFFDCLTEADKDDLRRILQKLTAIHRWTNTPLD